MVESTLKVALQYVLLQFSVRRRETDRCCSNSLHHLPIVLITTTRRFSPSRTREEVVDQQQEKEKETEINRQRQLRNRTTDLKKREEQEARNRVRLEEAKGQLLLLLRARRPRVLRQAEVREEVAYREAMKTTKRRQKLEIAVLQR